MKPALVPFLACLLLTSCDEWSFSGPTLKETLLPGGAGYRLTWEGDSLQTYSICITYLDGIERYDTRGNCQVTLYRYAHQVEVGRSLYGNRTWTPGYSRRSQTPTELHPCRQSDTLLPFGVGFDSDGSPVPLRNVPGLGQTKAAFWLDSARTQLIAGADSSVPWGRGERAFIITADQNYPARLAVAPPVEYYPGHTRVPLSESLRCWLWLDRGISGYDSSDHFVQLSVSAPVNGITNAVRVRTSFQKRGGLRWVLLD